MTTHKARLIRNAAFSSFSWAANIITNLVTIPVLVHFLGVETFGIYALLTGLFGYFALLDFGAGQGLVKYVAEYDGLHDHKSITQIVNAAIVAQFLVGLAGMSGLWWFNREIIDLLKVGSSFVEEARISLYISSFGFMVTMVLGNYSSVLQGLQRFDLIGKINIGFSIATAAAVIVALALGGRLREVMIVSVAFSTASAVTFVIAFKRTLPEYRFTPIVNRGLVKRLFTYSGYLFVSRGSNVLNNYFLRFIVGAFLGPAAVAFFVAPLKLVLAIQGALGSLASVLLPFASQALARGDQEEFHHVYIKASRYIASLGIPLFLFVIFFSQDILTLWMGKEFANAAWPVLVIAGVAWLISSFTIVPTNAVLGLGHSRAVGAFSLASAAINLGFCFWFTSLWGVTGAALSILITQTQALPFVWYVTEKLFTLDWRYYITQVMTTNNLAAAVFVLIGAVRTTIEITTVGAHQVLFAVGLGSVAVYLFLVQRAGAISLVDLRMLFGRKASTGEEFF